jgi:hypothetical protein
MRKLILPEQSWTADDARDSEGTKVAKSDDQASAQKPVDPAEISLSYARI